MLLIPIFKKCHRAEAGPFTKQAYSLHLWVFAAAGHTQQNVFISHMQKFAAATSTTATNQRLSTPFTLSLTGEHEELSPQVNDLLMEELVNQGMIRES